MKFARYFLIPLLALVPAVALAGDIPYPPNCTVPSVVRLVGRDQSGAADPMGAMSFVINRVSGAPCGGARVILDFSNAPDLVPSMQQPYPGVVAGCYGAQRTVSADCDAFGRVTFAVVGYADHGSASHQASLRIYSNGVFLSTIPVAAFDEDGGGGVGAADESLFFSDYFSPQYWQRSDFDGDGTLSANDLSLWEQAFFGGNSVQSAASTPTCP